MGGMASGVGRGVGMGAASTFALPRPAPPIFRPLPARCTCRTSSKPLPPRCVSLNPPSLGNGIPRRGGGFPVLAGGKGNGSSEEVAPPKGGEPPGGGGESSNGGKPGGSGTGKEPPRRGAATAGIRWGELLLDPDPDNVVAVGLTGLLAWASVQLLWQLFLISLAILLAALKYSFVAALLLLILITLL